MPRVETVVHLNVEFSNLGALLSRLKFYDGNTGDEWIITKVYNADDDEGLVCINLEKASIYGL